MLQFVVADDGDAAWVTDWSVWYWPISREALGQLDWTLPRRRRCRRRCRLTWLYGCRSPRLTPPLGRVLGWAVILSQSVCYTWLVREWSVYASFFLFRCTIGNCKNEKRALYIRFSFSIYHKKIKRRLQTKYLRFPKRNEARFVVQFLVFFLIICISKTRILCL